MPWKRELAVKVESPEAETGAVRSGAAPSRRVTTPVGEPEVVLATWLVSVMGAPGARVVAVARRSVRVVRLVAGRMVTLAVVAERV